MNIQYEQDHRSISYNLQYRCEPSIVLVFRKLLYILESYTEELYSTLTWLDDWWKEWTLNYICMERDIKLDSYTGLFWSDVKIVTAVGTVGEVIMVMCNKNSDCSGYSGWGDYGDV